MRYLKPLLLIVLLLSAALSAVSFPGSNRMSPSLSPAADRPPTPDPTYGLPLPRAAHKPVSPVGAGASWIWARQTTDTQRVGLRRVFNLARKPDAAMLWVTADDYFTLFVNGQQIGGTVARPGVSMEWQNVHHFNIVPLLTAGKNV